MDCAATIPTASRGSTFAFSYLSTTFLKISSSFSLVSFLLTTFNFFFNSSFILSDNSLLFTLSSMSPSFTSPFSSLPSISIISSAYASSNGISKRSSNVTVSSAGKKSSFICSAIPSSSPTFLSSSVTSSFSPATILSSISPC